MKEHALSSAEKFSGEGEWASALDSPLKKCWRKYFFWVR